MVFPLLAPFSDSDYPIDAPKKAPEIAESTVMMARMITPQIFLVGTDDVSSNIGVRVLKFLRINKSFIITHCAQALRWGCSMTFHSATLMRAQSAPLHHECSPS